MTEPKKADPALYPKLREHALTLRMPGLALDAIHAVLMDWHIGSGMATVLAAADGTASMYLSSGGGFIGGSHGDQPINTALRDTALRAVAIATELKAHAVRAGEPFPFPPTGSLFFYMTTSNGVLLAQAAQADLENGTSPFAPLGNAMQRIVSGYRIISEQRRETPN